jgi:hypothetical protein
VSVGGDRVRAELTRYEHPLFTFDARECEQGVQVEIRYAPPAPALEPYRFLLRPRELEHPQFPWSFQKQLYDCLHDYVIELFSRNPQRKD